jgi:hypothetical protein
MGEIKLSGEFLRQEVEPFYRELLGKIKISYPTDQTLTGFSALVGSQYEKSDSRLLVFGRAVDGWRNCWQSNSPIEESLTNIFKIPEDDKIAECEMNWILRSRKVWSSSKNGSKIGYNYKSSAFWCGTREVLKALEGKSVLTESDWPSRLAWSNIYKVSPSKSGNPQDKLRSIQIPHCIQILQAEISLLEPKNILFITGGWGIKILESIGIKPKNSTDKIVQFADNVKFNYGSVKVVVTIRPERQKRSLWVNEVASAFGI